MSYLSRVYEVFSVYPATQPMACTYCYSEEYLQKLSRTNVNDISIEDVKVLLGEVGDHWASTEAYKHYLPVMLRAIGPEHRIELIYPEHLFQNMLLFHGGKEWAKEEKDAVVDYLSSIENWLYSDEEDFSEWTEAFNEFKNS